MENDYPIVPNNGYNTGLIQEPPMPQDHIVGGVNVAGQNIIKPEPPIVFPTGHGWVDVITKNSGEIQANNNFDSFLCTIFAVAGALTDDIKVKYNEEIDISECIQGVLAGVKPGLGGTVRNSLESFRTLGWADEKYRQFNQQTTQSQCFAFVTNEIKNICKEKLDKYDIYWDLIDGSDNVPHSKIISNLTRSSVVVTGYAWASYYGNQGVFSDYNYPPNHCFRIVDGGDIPQSVKDKFNDRGYEIDWSLVDLIAKDSYRFNWRKDEADHTNLNDFLKPLSKDYRIHSAYRIYAIAKDPKKKAYLALLKKSMENFYYYWDGKHNFYYIGTPYGETKKYRQYININDIDTATKFLFIGLKGNMRQSNWAEISQYPDISSINKIFA